MVLVRGANDLLGSMLNIPLLSVSEAALPTTCMQTARSRFGCSLREMAAKKVSILPSTVLSESLKEGEVLMTYSLPQDRYKHNVQAKVWCFFV